MKELNVKVNTVYKDDMVIFFLNLNQFPEITVPIVREVMNELFKNKGIFEGNCLIIGTSKENEEKALKILEEASQLAIDTAQEVLKEVEKKILKITSEEV